MTKTFGRPLIAMVVVVMLATGPAKAAGTPGAGVGRLLGIYQPTPYTMTVSAVVLNGVIAFAGQPRVVQARVGPFSGTWYACETPTCLASGISGSDHFDGSIVPITGTATPGGPLSGSCHGGELFIADGSVLSTQCYLSLAGKTTGQFDLIVDVPLLKADGTFCTTQSILGAGCDYSDQVTNVVGGILGGGG